MESLAVSFPTLHRKVLEEERRITGSVALQEVSGDCKEQVLKTLVDMGLSTVRTSLSQGVILEAVNRNTEK